MTDLSFLHKLELPSRIVNLLAANGVTTEDELRSLDRDAFLSWRGAGPASWSELDAVRPRWKENGIVVLADKPRGYRTCSAPIRFTEKAVMVGYYGWKLWLPKRQVVLCDGRVHAPLQTIERAKDYAERNPVRPAAHSAPQTGVNDDQH